MGGPARDDLDVVLALQIAEGARDVAADAPVQLPRPLVEFFPEVGEPDEIVPPLLGELLAALDTGPADVLVVERQLLLELG